MRSPAEVTEGWAVAAADQPDAASAAVLRLDDHLGHSRILDRTSKVLFPPVPTADLVGRQVWYPASIDEPLDTLLVGVAVHDDVRTMRRRRPSKPTSLGRPRAQIRQWDPQAEIVLSRRRHVFSAEQASTWGALFTRVRRAKGRVNVAAYVDPDPAAAPWLPKWLRAPKPEPKASASSLDTTQHLALHQDVFGERWLLGQDDRLCLLPSFAAGGRPTLRSIEEMWTLAGGTFKVDVCDREQRSTRFFEQMGFADIVVFAAQLGPRHYPADLWNRRANALIVPARSPYAHPLLTALHATATTAVFLADPSSTRVWQHLTGEPDVARLETCLLRLVEQLGRHHDVPGIEDEVNLFLRSVSVGGLGKSARSRLHAFIRGNAALAPFDLDLD